jgi:protein-tyrosine phosphatase
VLDLSNNKLTALPDDIQYLSLLEKLIVGNNAIGELPESIGSVVNLVVLDANHNRLRQLPQSLMFCEKVEALYFDYNQFEELPMVVFDLPQLERAFFTANSISRWPRDDLNGTAMHHPIIIGVDNDPDLMRTAEAFSAATHAEISWTKVFPDPILGEWLFLGSLRTAQSQDIYARFRIKHVLTMGRNLEVAVPTGGTQKTIALDDIVGADISSALVEAMDYLAEAERRSEGCLVHCFAGISRSATTVIAYLMMKKGMRLDDAYVFVRSKRPAIYPNAGFFQQLLDLDRRLFPRERPLVYEIMEREVMPQ